MVLCIPGANAYFHISLLLLYLYYHQVTSLQYQSHRDKSIQSKGHLTYVPPGIN
jgi:hypothetical protein